MKPYVKRGKSDAIDAEAIGEAVTRKQMADVTAGTKTCAFGDCRDGQQGSTDRLGRSDPQRTMYTAHCLKAKNNE